MNGLDLFAGSGIGSLALKHTIPDYRTVCYVENDPYCQAVLVARIKDGLLEDAPIWDDVRTFNGSEWCGKVDIVSGGFPCQPFSVAGQRKGEADKRNLWPDTLRIIGEVRPRYAFLENVPGLSAPETFIVKALEQIRQSDLFGANSQESVSGRLIRHILKVVGPSYAGRICGDLAEIGYDCEWDVVSAAFVGAPHLRKRLWILAFPKSVRRRGRSDENGRGRREIQVERSSAEDQPAVLAYPRRRRTRTIQSKRQPQCGEETHSGKSSQDVAKSNGRRQQVSEKQHSKQKEDPANGDSQGGHLNGCSDEMAKTDSQRQADIQGSATTPQISGDGTANRPGWWDIEPPVGRVAHGIPCRVDRLKMLGNAWVPHVVRRILRTGSGKGSCN